MPCLPKKNQHFKNFPYGWCARTLEHAGELSSREGLFRVQ